MHNHFRPAASNLALGLAFGLAALSDAHAGGRAKTIVDLGTLGGASSFARGINEAGVVVGESQTAAGETHAFYWDPEENRMVDLGTLGGTTSFAMAINNENQVVGTSSASAGAYCGEPVVWDIDVPGQVTVLPELSEGMFSCSWPLAINHAGVIAGTSDGRAVRWEGGAIEELVPFPGAENCLPSGINERGWITGQCSTPYGSRGFLWKDGSMTDLGSLGGTTFSLNGINNRGQIVGYGDLPDGSFAAVLWQKGSFTTLPSLGGYANAHAVSENGTVVGEAINDQGQIQAVYWKKRGGIQLLEALPGSTFSSAFAVNNSGTIAGMSYLDTGDAQTSGTRAVIWR